MRYSVTVKFHKNFMSVDGKQIVVGVQAKPEKGKANEELIKKIAKHFKIAPSRVCIRSGARSQRKVIEIL